MPLRPHLRVETAGEIQPVPYVDKLALRPPPHLSDNAPRQCTAASSGMVSLQSRYVPDNSVFKDLVQL